MSAERVDIYLRAHTEKVRDSEKEKKPRSTKQDKALPDRFPPHALIVDTETRVDVHQRLMFGIYRVCKLVDGQYRTEKEGVVYSSFSEISHLSYAAVLEKKELNSIGSFVLNTFPDIELKYFPPRTRLEVHQSFPDFMTKVFWPAVRKGWLCTFFNAPFDLSRLSCDWRPMRRKRGFSLVLSKQLEHKSQTWIPHPYRPEIRIEPKDARTAFIKRGVPRFRKDEWPNPARFLDLSTLLFSLFDKHMSLDNWAAEFRKKGYKIDRKIEHEPSGRVTQDELKYCAGDVKTTLQLLNAGLQEFSRHPLPSLLPDFSYSPASVAKAYMHEMGIVRPMKKFNVPSEINGIAMQAYFGGRA
jgi:hypothetical protein